MAKKHKKRKNILHFGCSFSSYCGINHNTIVEEGNWYKSTIVPIPVLAARFFPNVNYHNFAIPGGDNGMGIDILLKWLETQELPNLIVFQITDWLRSHIEIKEIDFSNFQIYKNSYNYDLEIRKSYNWYNAHNVCGDILPMKFVRGKMEYETRQFNDFVGQISLLKQVSHLYDIPLIIYQQKRLPHHSVLTKKFVDFDVLESITNTQMQDFRYDMGGHFNTEGNKYVVNKLLMPLINRKLR